MHKLTAYSAAVVVFAVLYFSGHWLGYPTGFRHGYAGTEKQPRSDKLVQRVYDVDDLVSDGPCGQREFQQVIALITDQQRPTSWNIVGGKGSIKPEKDRPALVIAQTEDVHAEIRELFRQLREIEPGKHHRDQ